MNITFTGISTKLAEFLRSELKYEWSESEPGGTVALNATLRPGITLTIHHSKVVITTKGDKQLVIGRDDFREVSVL